MNENLIGLKRAERGTRVTLYLEGNPDLEYSGFKWFYDSKTRDLVVSPYKPSLGPSFFPVGSFSRLNLSSRKFEGRRVRGYDLEGKVHPKERVKLRIVS